MSERMRFEVVSGSMSPTLAAGDAVWVDPSARVRVGDVALFAHTSGAIVCHRILASVPTRGGHAYLHRGDAGGPVGVVAVSSIIGRAVERERSGARETLPRQEVSLFVRARALADWIARRASWPAPRPLPTPETDPAHIAIAYDRTAGAARSAFASDPRSVARYRTFERPIRDAARAASDVLDLGCGWGRVLDELPAGPAVVGVDVSPESLRIAASNGHCVVRADAHRLPFTDASFDLVIAANGVFRHLDARGAFAECARVLRPDGMLFAHFFNAGAIALRRRTDDRGLRSPSALDGWAAEAGLRREQTFLHRNVRFFPYSIRLPTVGTARLFSHAIVGWRRLPSASKRRALS